MKAEPRTLLETLGEERDEQPTTMIPLFIMDDEVWDKINRLAVENGVFPGEVVSAALTLYKESDQATRNRLHKRNS